MLRINRKNNGHAIDNATKGLRVPYADMHLLHPSHGSNKTSQTEGVADCNASKVKEKDEKNWLKQQEVIRMVIKERKSR